MKHLFLLGFSAVIFASAPLQAQSFRNQEPGTASDMSTEKNSHLSTGDAANRGDRPQRDPVIWPSGKTAPFSIYDNREPVNPPENRGDMVNERKDDSSVPDRRPPVILPNNEKSPAQ